MASCDPKYYPGVTSNIFQGLAQKLQGFGITLSGTEGTVEGPMGLSLDYAYDSANEKLAIHVTDRSFIIPCSQINKMLEDAMRDLGWQNPVA